ncbi:taurine dioxygenase [Leeia sp. TBRC 13508]|uniref:Taurine dioxygenase n=1 Tax=Leeia speluncae TaxID=2884804 RepID=A0ABS8DB97_9NEIS|nr:taurine dioxygenase [Leeia speluncae]MCB6185201.1 taurine dioxygenase [Leeia speluncae]
MTTLTVERLTPALGAEVSGLNLAEPLSNLLKQEISELLVEHQILFFRKQPLTDKQQKEFAANFGDLHVHPLYPKVAEQPEIMILDTHGDNPPDAIHWHSDVSCIERPPLGAILSAKLLPPIGGDTVWASATAAYDALSAPMKAYLEGLTAVHDLTQGFPEYRYAITPEKAAQWEAGKKANPPVIQPVIRVHPVSGKKAIFVNEDFTTRIVELPEAEGKAILAFLYQHISHARFTVRWRWQKDDVVFWDNRITQHIAVDDYLPHRRIVHRATILGDKPFGPKVG